MAPNILFGMPALLPVAGSATKPKGSDMTRLRDLAFTFVAVVAVGIMLVVIYPRLFGRDVYTLYSNSGRDMSETGYSAARLHIATFDANETGAYNQENCEIASKLFEQQYGVPKVNYWCEKGRYK